ncbi:hypothetical protein J2Y54_000186 [Sphingomonas sp. BE123]|jgi:hypothetical protein|uniref:hypothetical protein n=1 Tax=unclassified Sphingomonas TaxID=196159 RepID=UPI0028603509|nr:hypothetical protein [Sphingomonas sp. BE123]MDR6850693.1 hypothetical protein [Sphingomonas sp. BE123]
MRRQLILSGASRSHPFRARLPEVRAEVRRREDAGDLKLFALSFTAFFVCFYTFIS